jgi:YVTN family beta-propeller protein
MYGVALGGLRAASQTLLTTVPTGSHPAALGINLLTGKLYVANENSNTVTVIDEATDSTLAIPVGAYPSAIALNPVTNRIYVANAASNNVSVIDGASNTTAVVATGRSPLALAVNPATNQIFVANRQDNSITAINGSNNLTFTIPVGDYPSALAVNSLTNKIYVANLIGNNVTIIDGASGATTTVAAGAYPDAVAVNSLTNKIYVVNGNYAAGGAGSVTVIDGATTATTTVPVGLCPNSVAINPVTNKIYVTNLPDGTVTIIDGATNSTTTIPVGGSPGPVAVEPVTNNIYVANNLWYGTVTMIAGSTGSTTTVAVGQGPDALAIDSAANRVYVANLKSSNVSVIAGASSQQPLQFVPATPCRLVDTRAANGPFGGPALSGGTSRDFVVPNNLSCGIPPTAAAYSLNLAVIPHGPLGYVTLWPTGEDQPVVATLNSLDGRIKANAAIVTAGASGAVRIFVSNTTDVVLDIDGYFVPAPDPSAYAFFPLTPCRVADTRATNGPLGGPYLYGAQQRSFPVLAATSCGIPASAAAYSLNFAAIPRNGAPLGYLSVWPAGQSQPLVSTLNALTGTVTANAAIVPAGENGSISVYPSQDTDLVIDINGYFAASRGGLSLYSTVPCRVLDTRKTTGAFTGQLTVSVAGGSCHVPPTARAYVFNAVVVPQGPLGYLTLWPNGASRPLASTLNALDGAITSNMAIVPTYNGYIEAYAAGLTQLVLDISSYFAP